MFQHKEVARHGSPRFGKKSDWGHRIRHNYDGESEYSGSLRLSDGAEQARETKPSSSEIKDLHDDQLKHVQSELDMLEDHKHQLQFSNEALDLIKLLTTLSWRRWT